MKPITRRPCPYCGADVLLVGSPGNKTAVDVHETITDGTSYRIDAGELVPIASQARVEGHALHEETCTRQKGVVTHDGFASRGTRR